jgi:hypothetical protein
VKTDITSIVPLTALGQIIQLEPTTYRFITDDTRRLHHGLIAQSVERLIPESVTGTNVQFIPSIYRDCPVAADGRTITVPVHITGTRLRITDCSGGTHDIAMVVVDDRTVLCGEDLTQWIDRRDDTAQIFVHGPETDDGRSIDYNQILVVNVAATKQLAEELGATRTELGATRTELDATRTELDATKRCLDATRTEMAELKAMVKAMMR